MSDEDDTERPHDPSQNKLEKARERGEIPKSAELTAAVASAGFLMLTLLPGGWVAPELGALGYVLLDRADTIGPDLLSGGIAPASPVFLAVFWAMAPALLVPGGLVLATLFALRGLVFAPQKLAPKLSRISPLSNAKQKFGPSGLLEFAKSAVKLAIFCGLLWFYLWSRLPEILSTSALTGGLIVQTLGRLLVEFLAMIVGIMLLVGGVDTLFQHFDHRRQQRMSQKELRDEHKESEGDPHQKQHRRARAQEIASNRMLSDVPKASVIIVNPTHYAVALQWSMTQGGAPICVAKGVDETAAKIRELAAEHGIPIRSDPPTARALYATTKLGQEIAPEHYQAVAAAIRFAEAMRTKAGRHRAQPR